MVVVLDRRVRPCVRGKSVKSKIRSASVRSGRGALVREEKSLSSQSVCRLLCGTQVLCTDLVGKTGSGRRRRQIVAPCFGWVSESALDMGEASRLEGGLTEALKELTCALRQGRNTDTRLARLIDGRIEDDDDVDVDDDDDDDDERSSQIARGQERKVRKKKRRRPTEHISAELGVAPLQLHAHDFDAALAAGTLFASFQAPWCSYSQNLQGTWAQAAGKLLGSVRVAVVDVSAAPDMAFRFGIRALPSLLLFHRGTVFEYSGPRSLDAIVAFAKGGFLHDSSTAFPIPPPSYHPAHK